MKQIIFLIAIIVAVLLSTGCTEELEQKNVLKEDVLSKSLVDTSSDYLYVPSVVTAPRSVGASRPFWQGQAKRVRFEFTKDSLRAVELEHDERFAGNASNNKPVVEIPIEHKDYKCAEDAYGDCTNQEIENEEIARKEKAFFAPKFEEMNQHETNILPVQIDNLFNKCYSEESSKIVKYEFEEDAVNFQIEKTYKVEELKCLDSLESLSDLSFTVRYHYSFVKLDTVTTPDYQPIVYDRADEGLFGYFDTVYNVLDVDNSDREDGRIAHMNRWAPQRTVDYYLNDAFAKSENASLLKATQHAFNAINQSLEMAGAKLRLNLKGVDTTKEPGDIRNSMIIMVEDPQALSVIGYGPSVANPLTGEIVQARTVMYSGTIKKFIQYTYDEIVRSMKEAEVAKTQKSVRTINLTNEVSEQSSASPQAESKSSSQRDLMINLVRQQRPISDIAQRRPLEKDVYHRDIDRKGWSTQVEDLRAQIEILSRSNAYTAEVFNFNSAIEGAAKEIIQKYKMKSWIELADSEKQEILEVLMPYVWVPTLIHEIGHNLGLRHNFAGSEDKDNFYSAEELKNIGSSPMAYSSIMDYAYNSTNELRVMGKYDIAALRYGYAEKVELNNGELIDMKDYERHREGVELKTYDYCTDEHVSVNPNCNRFDEGTNLTEIVQHQIRAYELRYRRSNFRNGRRNFSLMDDVGQLRYLVGFMSTLRLNFERYERIKHDFGVGDDSELWQSIEFLKDLRQATALGGQFLVNLLAIPDVHCVISAATDPKQIVAALPLVQLAPSATTCLDSETVQLNPSYVIVGEFGKSFQSKKDPLNQNPFADQIDVRGIWMDKLLAITTLTERDLGSILHDGNTENYFHMPEVQAPAVQMLANILTDEHQGVFEVETTSGEIVALRVNYSLQDGHDIPEPIHSDVKRHFELNGNTSFQRKAQQITVNKNYSEDNDNIGIALAVDSLFSVSDHTSTGRDPSEYRRVDIGSHAYFALPQNQVALVIMNYVQTLRELSGVDPSLLEQALIAMDSEGEEIPEELLSTVEKVKKVGVANAIKFMQGELKSLGYYSSVLKQMSHPPADLE